MMYDAGATRMGIMAGYSAGAAIIALLTVMLVPHQGFVVGDSGLINWKNGAKVGVASEKGSAMRTLQIDPEADGGDAVVDDADDAYMLAGQQSSGSDSYNANVATSPPPLPATEAAGHPDRDFQSLPFPVQARSPRHILLLLIFGTTIARMAFFFGTFNAQVSPRKYSSFFVA